MKAPQGARVLVLEDEAIIAIDVENILTDAAFPWPERWGRARML